MVTTRIAFATSNKHKLQEANHVLKDYGVELYMAPAPKLEIQSSRLEDIAVYAAVQAHLILQKPVIVEDAGLFIPALKGFPGPYSSYVYKTIGVEGLAKLMEGVSNRRAYFLSVVAYADENGVKVFTGRVDGVIAEKPRGSKGFGFDPLFIPYGSDKTFAEMELEEKNRYSHRAKAFRKLGEWLASRQHL